MQIRRQLLLSTVAVVLAGGTSLMAQVTTGALNGKLTDASGKPVVGAKVTLESSALFNPRVIVTDANGDYRALLLPVGDYTVRVSATGLLGKTAHNVRIGVGSNLTLPFVLNPLKTDTAAQTVEVVSDMAAASKTDDKISTNFSAEKLLQLPTGGGPSFAGALGATPGITGSWDAASTKVRGSETNQVMYRVNGINVKDDTGGGALYSPLPDSIEDIQVVLTALNARFGSVSGGQVNVVTKSGSNEFEGSIRAEFSRPSWNSDQKRQSANLADNRAEKFSNKVDVIVSGPIIKDRLWFYLGTRFQPSENVQGNLAEQARGIMVDAAGKPTGTVQSWDYVKNHLTGSNTMGAVPDVDETLRIGPSGYSVANYMTHAGETVYGNREYKKYDMKLTGAITDAHLLSGTYLYEKTTEGARTGERNNGNMPTVDPNQVGTITTETKGWTLNWNGTLASNWTIEARISKMERTQTDVQRKAGDETGPSIWMFMQSDSRDMKLRIPSISWQDQYQWQNIGSPKAMTSYNTPEKRGNGTMAVNVTTFQEFKGQHQIDFGFQRDTSLWNFGRARAGSRAIYNAGGYADATGKMLYPVIYRTPLNNGIVPQIRNGYQGGQAANGGAADPIEATVNDPGLYTNAGLGKGWGGAPAGSIWGMPDRSTDGWRLAGDIYTQWWQPQTVGTHMERAWVKSGDEKNNTDAIYVNDSWTIDSKWNVMVGARYSNLHLQQYGEDSKTMHVFEPRGMVKFNPDGDNKNIYSFSFAKLSQAYSDKIANYFRGNEWTISSMNHWIGTALNAAAGAGNAQHGFDSVAAQTDTPTGTFGGYTYTGANMHGVRFVDYATLTDPNNYSKTSLFVDKRQTTDISSLSVPYALEANLGFQHNFSQGWFKLNAVQRKYHDRILGQPWAALTNFSKDNYILMNSPVTGSTQQEMAWKDIYPSSKHGQTYRSLEFSFDRQLTSRWDLTGSFTLAKTTGVNEEEYYTNPALREALLSTSERDAVVPDTVLTNDKYGYLAVTYVQPVGKGNVSFSARLNYNNNGGYGSLNFQRNYQDNANWATYVANIPKKANAAGVVWQDTGNDWGSGKGNFNYNTYFGAAGQYRNSMDTFSTDVKLNADVPIYKKIRLIGYISINNIFNTFQMTSMYTAMNDRSGQVNGDVGVTGRSYQKFDATHVFGQASNIKNPAQLYSDYNWGNAGRQVTNVSIGLKF